MTASYEANKAEEYFLKSPVMLVVFVPDSQDCLISYFFFLVRHYTAYSIVSLIFHYTVYGITITLIIPFIRIPMLSRKDLAWIGQVWACLGFLSPCRSLSWWNFPQKFCFDLTYNNIRPQIAKSTKFSENTSHPQKIVECY